MPKERIVCEGGVCRIIKEDEGKDSDRSDNAGRD